MSTLFNPDTGSVNEESIHDITMEFSFDVSDGLEHFTSKSTTIADHLIRDSEASSPVSFTRLMQVDKQGSSLHYFHAYADLI